MLGELDDIMTLLAIGVVADGRVAHEETKVFQKAVAKITLSNSGIELPSEEAAMSWFSHYQSDIRSIVTGPVSTYESRLNALLDSLASHIRPEALIHILQMISIADGELHESETELIAFIKHRWQIV